MFEIKEITEKEFSMREHIFHMLESEVPNFYYCLKIQNQEYVFTSNSDVKGVLIKEFEHEEKIFFVSERRLYVFSSTTGAITLMLRLWSYEIDIVKVGKLALLINEREVYKIELDSCVLHSIVGGSSGWTINMTKPVLHETGHMIGFDERYRKDTKEAYPGYKNDIMSAGLNEKGMNINQQHFVDIAQYGLQQTGGKDTPDNQPIILHNKGVDNTEGGTDIIPSSTSPTK